MATITAIPTIAQIGDVSPLNRVWAMPVVWAVAVALIGYWAAGAVAGAVALTVIPVELPALTIVAAAWAAPVSDVVIVQSGVGPVAVAETVTSWAPSFCRVKGKLNAASEAPVRVGEAVVSVMSPPAPAATRTEIARLAVPPPPDPLTVRLVAPSAASPGTENSRGTGGGLPRPTRRPST